MLEGYLGEYIESGADLGQALHESERHTESCCLPKVMLEPGDRSPALQRLAERLGARI
jgi:hypothetical protein